MLVKIPKKSPVGRKVFGGLIIVETALFGFSYFVYNRLEHNRDFRYKIKNNYPWVLEKYYQFDEAIRKENANQRKLDKEIWATYD